jgi:hypothetical protein
MVRPSLLDGSPILVVDVELFGLIEDFEQLVHVVRARGIE